MNDSSKEYSNIVETLISIFTIDKGKLKVLLLRKKTEPYKGYWTLPGGFLTDTETLEDNISDVVFDKCGIPNLFIEQAHVFSEINRNPDERIIACSFIGLIDSKSIEIKREERSNIESSWFTIDAIPKMGYDHEIIIENAIEHLRKKIVNSNVLKSLFPSDFTLPELQRVYEQILGQELDRRNFRKKFINLGLIEDTGYKNEGANGRPAKLYQFKEEIKERNLF
jgi:8-oxo-dGTP diphosphatase